jgi:hypothetical protein
VTAPTWIRLGPFNPERPSEKETLQETDMKQPDECEVAFDEEIEAIVHFFGDLETAMDNLGPEVSNRARRLLQQVLDEMIRQRRPDVTDQTADGSEMLDGRPTDPLLAPDHDAAGSSRPQVRPRRVT